jgi:hypothetical protein
MYRLALTLSIAVGPVCAILESQEVTGSSEEKPETVKTFNLDSHVDALHQSLGLNNESALKLHDHILSVPHLLGLGSDINSIKELSFDEQLSLLQRTFEAMNNPVNAKIVDDHLNGIRSDELFKPVFDNIETLLQKHGDFDFESLMEGLGDYDL